MEGRSAAWVVFAALLYRVPYGIYLLRAVFFAWVLSTAVTAAAAKWASSYVASSYVAGIQKREPSNDPSKDVTRRRWRAQKVTAPVDVVVIGSGVSGMACAAALSQMGRSVLVLEQHDRLGGATHAFTWVKSSSLRPPSRPPSRSAPSPSISNEQLSHVALSPPPTPPPEEPVTASNDTPVPEKPKFKFQAKLAERKAAKAASTPPMDAQEDKPVSVACEFPTGMYFVSAALADPGHWRGKLFRSIMKSSANDWRAVSVHAQVHATQPNPLLLGGESLDDMARLLSESLAVEGGQRVAVRWFLQDYFRALKRAQRNYSFKLLGVLLGAAGQWLTKQADSVARTPAEAVWQQCVRAHRHRLDFSSPAMRLLRSTLMYPYSVGALEPQQMSLAAHAYLSAHFSGGAAVPVNSQNLSRGAAEAVVSAGGNCLVGARVTGIDVRLSSGGRYRVEGVRVARAADMEGEEADLIPCSHVVFSGAAQQLQGLVRVQGSKGADELSRQLKAASDADRGLAHQYLFVALKGDPEELGLPVHATWQLTLGDGQDLVEARKMYLASESPEQHTPPAVCITFPCAADRTWGKHSPRVSNCVVIAECNWSWFEEWEAKRNSNYKDLKERFAQTLLAVLLARFPQLCDRVHWYELGTPLSDSHYLCSPEGASFGPRMTVESFGRGWATGPDEPPVDGLLLSGQSTVVAGVEGAFVGGLLAAHRVLGWKQSLALLLNGCLASQ